MFNVIFCYQANESESSDSTLPPLSDANEEEQEVQAPAPEVQAPAASDTESVDGRFIRLTADAVGDLLAERFPAANPGEEAGPSAERVRIRWCTFKPDEPQGN